jgi:hypothetical protein
MSSVLIKLSHRNLLDLLLLILCVRDGVCEELSEELLLEDIVMLDVGEAEGVGLLVIEMLCEEVTVEEADGHSYSNNCIEGKSLWFSVAEVPSPPELPSVQPEPTSPNAPPDWREEDRFEVEATYPPLPPPPPAP